MNSIKVYLVSLAIAIFGSVALAPVSVAAVYDPLAGACKDSNSDLCKGENKDQQVEPIVKTIVNVLLFIVGGLSVVMIIVAGLMYSISGGDSGKVSRAKNMLTYAIVGLIVAFVAYAIINWVIGIFIKPAP